MVFTGITTVIKKWAGLVIFHAKAGNITSYSMEIFVFPAIAGTRIFPGSTWDLSLLLYFQFNFQDTQSRITVPSNLTCILIYMYGMYTAY